MSIFNNIKTLLKSKRIKHFFRDIEKYNTEYAKKINFEKFWVQVDGVNDYKSTMITINDELSNIVDVNDLDSLLNISITGFDFEIYFTIYKNSIKLSFNDIDYDGDDIIITNNIQTRFSTELSLNNSRLSKLFQIYKIYKIHELYRTCAKIDIKTLEIDITSHFSETVYLIVELLLDALIMEISNEK